MIAISPVLPSHPQVNEVNVAKNQPEYIPLPSAILNRDGVVTMCFCHKLSPIERLQVLVSGRIWFEQMTFGQPLQPHRASTTEPIP